MTFFYTILVRLLLLCIVFSLESNQEVQAQDNGFVVIVNQGNPIGQMTVGQVKLYYLRKIKKRWPSIQKNIRPVDRVGTPSVKNLFLKQVVRMSNGAMSQYFTQKQYTNAETPPIRLSNDTQVVNYVQGHVGAIGYISKGTYQAVKNKVKAVLIID